MSWLFLGGAVAALAYTNYIKIKLPYIPKFTTVVHDGLLPGTGKLQSIIQPVFDLHNVKGECIIHHNNWAYQHDLLAESWDGCCRNAGCFDGFTDYYLEMFAWLPLINSNYVLPCYVYYKIESWQIPGHMHYSRNNNHLIIEMENSLILCRFCCR